MNLEKTGCVVNPLNCDNSQLWFETTIEHDHDFGRREPTVYAAVKKHGRPGLSSSRFASTVKTP
jgi:hypothetical protein